MSQSGQPDFEKARAEAENTDMSAMFSGITELGAMAAQTYEMYETHVNAGFTNAQSLYLVAAIFTNNPGIPPGH